MHIELIDSADRLNMIRGQWLDLMTRSSADDFFLLPQWIMAWWSIFCQGRALFFVAAWLDERLCGIFPLVKMRKGPFRVIAFAGLPRAGRMDFLLDDHYRAECLAEFVHWLFNLSDWDLLSLRAFGPFSKNPQFLVDLLSEKGKPYTFTKDKVCYYIPTSKYEDVDQYLKDARGAKTCKALRRKKRKFLNEHGGKWNIVAALNESLIDEMVDLDSRRSMRGNSGNSFFSSASNTAFLKALIHEIVDEDRIRIACLRMGGRLYAFDLLFLYSGNVLSYQTAFDRSLYPFSAGNLTLLESLQFAVDNKKRTYDFLSGDDGYKREWTDRYHQNWRLQVYRRGARASVLLFYHRVVKPLRKRIKNISALDKVLPDKLRSRWDI